MDIDSVLGLDKKRGALSPMGYAIAILIMYFFVFVLGLIIFVGSLYYSSNLNLDNYQGLSQAIVYQYFFLLLLQILILIIGMVYSIRLVSKLEGEIAVGFISISLLLTYMFYQFYALMIGLLVASSGNGGNYTSEDVSAGFWINFAYFVLLILIILSSGRINAMKEVQEHPKKESMWPYGRTREGAMVIPAISKPTVKNYEEVSLAECPVCHRRIPGDSLICPYCGTKFNRAKAVCGSCGREIPPDAVVCPYCGAKLR